MEIELNGARSDRRWAVAALAAFFLLGWSLGAWLLLSGAPAADAGPGQAYRETRARFAVPFAGEWYTVDVQLLMHDDGSGGFGDAAAAARAELAARFPGAVELRPGEVTASYVQQGYWWTAHGVAWSYNAAGKPAGLSGEYEAIAAAARTWNSSGVNFTFTAKGPTSAGTGACSGSGLDGFNTIGWRAQSGSVLAVTCSWYAMTGNPMTATEFDMEIDPDWEWTTGAAAKIDVESVVLHELGHAIGLGHSAEGNAVMYASYCAGCIKRKLDADDIAGARGLYGATAPSPTAPPATATPPPVTPTPVKTAPPAATPSRTATPKPALPLMPGANLLAWPGASQPASQAFANQPGLSVVYSWDAASQSWKRYIPGVPAYVNNLKTVEPGQVYWFIASSAGGIPIGQ